jgi:hypothetical protein
VLPVQSDFEETHSKKQASSKVHIAEFVEWRELVLVRLQRQLRPSLVVEMN